MHRRRFLNSLLAAPLVGLGALRGGGLPEAYSPPQALPVDLTALVLADQSLSLQRALAAAAVALTEGTRTGNGGEV